MGYDAEIRILNNVKNLVFIANNNSHTGSYGVIVGYALEDTKIEIGTSSGSTTLIILK